MPELAALLNETRHTDETIGIVNRLYARDFELLGENAVRARTDTRKNTRECVPRAVRSDEALSFFSLSRARSLSLSVSLC